MKKILFSIFLGFLSTGISAQYLWSNQPGPAQGMDTQLRFQYPTQNGGQIKDFKAIAWTCGVPCGSRGLLKFDLKALIDSAAIVDSAFLYLYHNPTSSDPGHSTLSGSNATYLRRVTSAWEELTVTLNTQPSYDTVGQFKISSTISGNENYKIPVKDMVQLMLDTTEGNHGWIMMLENETAYRSMIFASSDNLDATIRPRLDVFYRVSGLSEAEKPYYSPQELQLFPNPANNDLSLKWTQILDYESTLTLSDIQGRIIQRAEIQAGLTSVSLDISKLSKGTYFVRIEGEGTLMQSKFLILD